jgi:hypothetical protein
MFLLAPASRAGYFVYPLGLSAWLRLTMPGSRAAVPLRPRRPRLIRKSGSDGAKQQVVDDPAAPQQLHLPDQDVGGRAVPEWRGR